MRKKLVAANWKMNGSRVMVQTLINGLQVRLTGLASGVDIAILPPAPYLVDVSDAIAGSALRLGGQNIARWEGGAYTGEMSGAMLSDVGCQYALIGHSERRQLFAETDTDVADKIAQAVGRGLSAIVCVGETLEQREAGEAVSVVSGQLKAGLASVNADQWHKIVIAYEPVWAIGTGRTASPEDAQAMHQAIRETLAELGAPAAETVLLYGGSVKPDNAAELFAQADIDGGLIGGASLIAEDFAAICQAAADAA